MSGLIHPYWRRAMSPRRGDSRQSEESRLFSHEHSSKREGSQECVWRNRHFPCQLKLSSASVPYSMWLVPTSLVLTWDSPSQSLQRPPRRTGCQAGGSAAGADPPPGKAFLNLLSQHSPWVSAPPQTEGSLPPLQSSPQEAGWETHCQKGTSSVHLDC